VEEQIAQDEVGGQGQTLTEKDKINPEEKRHESAVPFGKVEIKVGTITLDTPDYKGELKMDYSEKWGKDVDEAVRIAMDDLGVTEEQVTAGHVMVTVLEEPAKGFLGLGSKLAKVRVEKIHVDEAEAARDFSDNEKLPQQRANRDLRKNKSSSGGGQRSQGRPDRGGQGRPDRGDRRDRGERGGRPDRGGRGGDHRGGQRSERPDRQERPYVRPEDEEILERPSLSERPENLTPIEDNEASLFLKDILNKMSLEVEIKTYQNEECIFLEVDGKDSRTVIGKRGQTLDSIQYLTNLVTNKDKDEYQRVIIDVEGYRSRREKTLERLAVKLARKVQKSGRSMRLEPMNPYERKVIHSTLQTMDGITTRSEGEEPYRRVIIDKKQVGE
jgi:spoIIIJ-associated protein